MDQYNSMGDANSAKRSQKILFTLSLVNTTQSPKPRPSLNREVSNEFRPSSWITDVIPRKSPFVPQMGDEVCFHCPMLLHIPL